MRAYVRYRAILAEARPRVSAKRLRRDAGWKQGARAPGTEL